MSQARIEREPDGWEWFAAVASFVVAVVSVAVGFVLTTDWILDAGLHPALHAVGIVLLIIGIPLVILGGHCMDLGDRKHCSPAAHERLSVPYHLEH
jgi:predicted Na+-dependent transporter